MNKKLSKKIIEKKEFVTPTRFELTLTHKDKEVLIPVVEWLLTGNASSSFQWEWALRERNEEYLYEIAKLFGDYNQE